jgi:hypothetical protein
MPHKAIVKNSPMKRFIELAADIERYNIPYRKALSVKLCESCIAEVLISMDYPEDNISLKMCMGFTIHQSTYEDCLLCLKEQ